MKFLVDAQLPKALADHLVAAGLECLHTLDLEHANRTSDSTIRELATRDGYIVVTKDSDFVDSHVLHGSPPKLLLVSTGNIGNKQLLALFQEFRDNIVGALRDSSFVEITRDGLAIHD